MNISLGLERILLTIKGLRITWVNDNLVESIIMRFPRQLIYINVIITHRKVCLIYNHRYEQDIRGKL